MQGDLGEFLFLEHRTDRLMQPLPTPQRITQTLDQQRGRRWKPELGAVQQAKTDQERQHQRQARQQQRPARRKKRVQHQREQDKKLGQQQRPHRTQRPDGQTPLEGVEHVGVELHAGHRPRQAGNRRGQGIVHAAGRRTDQYVFVAERRRIDGIAQHLAVRIMAEVPRRAGERNQYPVVAPPDVRRRGTGCLVQPLAGQRPFAGSAGRLQHGQRQGGPIGRAKAGFQIGAARDAIGVQPHIDMPDTGHRFCQDRQRQGFHQLATRAVLFAEHRQDYPAAVRQRGGQLHIRLRVGGVGFGKHDIQGDGLGAGRAELADQGGVNAARPGPATQLPQALLVDGDDGDIVGRLSRPSRQVPVVDQKIPTVQPVRPDQQQGENGQHDQQTDLSQPAGAGSTGRCHRAKTSVKKTTKPTGQ